jgi:hypothetical protein
MSAGVAVMAMRLIGAWNFRCRCLTARHALLFESRRKYPRSKRTSTDVVQRA